MKLKNHFHILVLERDPERNLVATGRRQNFSTETNKSYLKYQAGK